MANPQNLLLALSVSLLSACAHHDLTLVERSEDHFITLSRSHPYDPTSGLTLVRVSRNGRVTVKKEGRPFSADRTEEHFHRDLGEGTNQVLLGYKIESVDPKSGTVTIKWQTRTYFQEGQPVMSSRPG